MSEKKTPSIKIIEIIVFTVIWLAIMCIPFFIQRSQNIVDWNKVINSWTRLSMFLLLFVLNYYVLVPLFLFRKKYVNYLLSTLLFTVSLIAIHISLRHFFEANTPISMPPMNLGPGMPPMELGSNMPAPMGFKPPDIAPPKSPFMIFIDNMIVAILVIAAGTAVKMILQWINEENRRIEVEKEQLKTELALLRNQVSPHFFMNTLNNIHALVDINPHTAQKAIIRLSTLMRYLLYDSARENTSLKKELEFIESYMSLMELRYSQKVHISLDLPTETPDVLIHPMLFVSFLENAFKHGVSYQKESYVKVKLWLTDSHIFFDLRNSIHPNREHTDKNYSGIGLTNIQKTLHLLYGKEYSLNISDEQNEFNVQLIIPIYVAKMHSHR